MTTPTTPPIDITKKLYRCKQCGGYDVQVRQYTTGQTYTGQRAKDGYDYVKTYDYWCRTCNAYDTVDDNAPDYATKTDRWKNPAYVDTYTNAQFKEDTAYIIRKQEEADRAFTWPRDPRERPFYEEQHAEDLRKAREEYARSLPENEQLIAAILAEPERDDVRREYAAWMRLQPPSKMRELGTDEYFQSPSPPPYVAWFIDAQLDAYEALRADPRADVTPLLRVEDYQGSLPELRTGFVSGHGDYDLDTVRLFTDHWMFVRGFIEHLAIKARAFLGFADFLYTLAPLRHLTLTYAGPVIAELAASPHFARLRSLILPSRLVNKPVTRLNELTDADLAVLARSPHLGKLNYLELDDAIDLTPRALDHLALSPYLPVLSHVRLDISYYDRVWGSWGDHRATLLEHRTESWRAQLEERHGYLPWLHADELYGASSPLFEIVCAHPVGDPTFRPDLAARCRPRLPLDVVDALSRCLTPDGQLRDRTLDVGLPSGRVVASLVRAAPDPMLPDLRTLVTLTFTRVDAPFPVHDHATGRTATAATGVTVTLGVPTPELERQR